MSEKLEILQLRAGLRSCSSGEWRVVLRMEREYLENLLGGVWEARFTHEKPSFTSFKLLVPHSHRKAWEHAHHESSAERRKAAAKAEIERMRKEEPLGRLSLGRRTKVVQRRNHQSADCGTAPGLF